MQIIALDLTKPEQVINIDQDSELLGLFVGEQEEQVKTVLRFVHARPNLKSRVHIKAVVSDQSKFDCEAMLVIEKGAVNTDAYLKIDCLIVDAGARARAVPGLEIMQDAVKGGHGATVGKISETQLHYLTSRGLRKETAKKLIIDAFISEVRQKLS